MRDVSSTRAVCNADLTQMPEGPLMAQMVSYGATTPWTQVATLVAGMCVL